MFQGDFPRGAARPGADGVDREPGYRWYVTGGELRADVGDGLLRTTHPQGAALCVPRPGRRVRRACAVSPSCHARRAQRASHAQAALPDAQMMVGGWGMAQSSVLQVGNAS